MYKIYIWFPKTKYSNICINLNLYVTRLLFNCVMFNDFHQEKEDEKFKRDVSMPTLEDHFDKSILPKVMQVRFQWNWRSQLLSSTDKAEKFCHLGKIPTTKFVI